MLVTALALIGLCIGSFVGSTAWRWPLRAADLADRSRCPACGVSLRAPELVPVLSWLVRRGRCAACREPIPVAYPVIELLAAGIGAAAALGGDPTAAVLIALVGWWLLLIAAIDLGTQLLPHGLTLPLAAAGLLGGGLTGDADLVMRVAGCAAGGLGLWLVAWAYQRLRGRQGLGTGDPALFAATGAWLGLEQLPAVLLIATTAALALALAEALRTGRPLTATRRMAFAPYLAGAFWVLLVAPWLMG